MVLLTESTPSITVLITLVNILSQYPYLSISLSILLTSQGQPAGEGLHPYLYLHIHGMTIPVTQQTHQYFLI